MTDQMEQVEQVADVLKNWRKYSSPESTRGRSHSGLKHIKGHEEVAAKRILQRNWNGRMVVSSMFKMAQYVESALDLKLSWLERYHLARLLMSSLTFAGIYKCVQENQDDSFSPYVIHSLVGHEPPKDRPSFKTRIGKPFPKWTKNVDRWGNVLVKSANNVPPEFEYSPEVFDQPKYHHPFLDAVHKLERIPFRVNEELLDLVIELDKNPDTRIIHGAPPDDVLEERQQKLAELYDQYDMDTVNAKWQAHPSKKIKEITTMNDDEKMRHQRYYKQKHLIEDWVKSFEERRKRFLVEVDQANDLRGKVFYQRVKVGHNGRIYFPEGLSYQGSDFSRAVIEFAEGMPLNDQAWRYINLHATNVHGDKGDIENRIQERSRNVFGTAYTALFPVQEFDDWSTADKPYCFLRVCLEIADACALMLTRNKVATPQEYELFKKNSPDFVAALQKRGKKGRGYVQDGKIYYLSHLPVELDQSNSAFAHIGLLMGNKELQKKAGMGQEWSDVYSEIAESVNLGGTNEVTSPISWGKTGFVVDEERVAASGPTQAETRKIIKKVSVPWSYGAGIQTCADAIIKIVDENPNKYQYLKGLDIEEINDLALQVIRVLEDRFKVCSRYRNRVKKAVTAAKKAGKESIEWTAPFGFEVVHRKYKLKPRSDEVWSGEKEIYPQAWRPTEPSWKDLKTSTPAVFVHSMDAALIHGVLAYGAIEIEGSLEDRDFHVKGHLTVDKKGEYLPIITVHDCFACHASFAPELQQVLLRGLRTMYEHYEPFNHFLNMAESTGPVPMPQVDESDYSWEKWAKNAFS